MIIAFNYTNSLGIGHTYLLQGNHEPSLYISNHGNVSIGNVPNESYRLNVCGHIRAQEVVVETGWCDYVFEPTYALRSLEEVESYILANKHLSDVPPACDIELNGLKLAEMNATLMRKVEELTLYLLQLKKEIETLKKETK